MDLPQPTAADHERDMVSVTPQPGTLTSDELMVTEPQVSLPVAEPLAATLVSAGHSKPVASAGHVRVGAAVSVIVTVVSHASDSSSSSV